MELVKKRETKKWGKKFLHQHINTLEIKAV